jgi:transposase
LKKLKIDACSLQKEVDMYKLNKWMAIDTLFKRGLSKLKIAELVGCNRKTVRIILEKIKNNEEPKRKETPSIIDPYKDEIKAKVAQDLSAVRIYNDLANERNYKGSYETVKNFVRKIKLSKDIWLSLPTVPGQEAQVDFGYIGKIPDENKKLRKAWVFCFTLSHSRKSYFEVVFSQKVKTFLQCHINAFHYFGGVPKTIKIDNLKSAILNANFYEPEYQKEYINLANWYNFSPIPCRIKTPTDKGKVESMVKYVKNNFFKGREFKDIDECNRKLKEWQEEICNQRIHSITKRRPAELFEKEEKQNLIPLPDHDFKLSEWVKRTVAANCHISFENNFYSVPYAYVHKEVIVQATSNLIKIYADNELIAQHPKVLGKGRYQTTPSHYPDYKFILGEKYEEEYKQKMYSIGKEAGIYFEHLLNKQPNYWIRSAKGIINLAKNYGNELVNLACKRAMKYDVYCYKIIKNICDKHLIEDIDEPSSLIVRAKYDFQRPLKEYDDLWKN